MALDPKVQAATALHRFGFAPKPGIFPAFSSDPRGALITELDRASSGQIVNDDLLSSGEAARAAFDFRQERKGARLAQRVAHEQARAAQAEAKNNPPKTTDAVPEMPTQVTKSDTAAADAQMPEAKPKQQPGVSQQII